VATLAVAALSLGILGPGSVSIDSGIGLADNLDGWIGLVILAAGALGGALQLAVLWRRPIADAGSPTAIEEVVS
jgi:hypothetical protein